MTFVASRSDRIWLGVTVAVAVVLKAHYSMATSEELEWILGPTTALVAAATGASFVSETGTGYLSTDLDLLIAPACAGVNFLIVAFCSGVFGLLPLVGHRKRREPILAATLLLSYGVTLVVNALRILIGLGLRGVAQPFGWMATADAHRMEGVVVYVSALCGVFLLARWSMLRGASQEAGGGCAPEAFR